MRSLQGIKIIGTISLGLLTGTLISTPLVTVPALLSLPNSASASRAYDVAVLRLHQITTALSTLAAVTYATALIFATRKHPYLMYSGFLSTVAGLWTVRGRILRRKVVEDGFEYLDAENAEVVRDRIMWLRDWIGLGIAGLGFAVAVVGGYGEGFTD